MTHLIIKDIEHLESVIDTIKTNDTATLNLFCSQSFYDKLLKQCEIKFNPQGEGQTGIVTTFSPTMEVYLNSEVPDNCALLQGKEMYLLIFTE